MLFDNIIYVLSYNFICCLTAVFIFLHPNIFCAIQSYADAFFTHRQINLLTYLLERV